MKNIEEFLDDCSINQKQEIIRILIEDGLIPKKAFPKRYTESLNDEFYRESLNILATRRHLLSINEENFINNLASKFKIS